MDISTSGDWAQDESLVALLAQNPFFNDDTVREQILSRSTIDLTGYGPASRL